MRKSIFKQTAENHIIRLDTKEQMRSAYPMIAQQTHKNSNPANIGKTMELMTDGSCANLPAFLQYVFSGQAN